MPASCPMRRLAGDVIADNSSSIAATLENASTLTGDGWDDELVDVVEVGAGEKLEIGRAHV